MKSSLSLMLSALVLPAMLLMGCGGDSGSNDLTVSVNDLSGTAHDMTKAACTAVATWPSNNVEVLGGPTSSAPFDFVTIGHAQKTAGSQTDALSVELWHTAGAPSAIGTVMLAATDTYNTCDTCLLLDENYDPTMGFGDTGFFGRAGTITITKADRTPAAGMMAVSGTNVNLVEWDFMNDKPVTNGKCYDVAAFSMSGSYSNPDGGTDM